MTLHDVQDIVHRLETEDPLQLGAPVAWNARRLERRRFSSIHLLEPRSHHAALQARAGSDALVLKIYHGGPADRRQREFDDLRRVWDEMGPTAGVVRPVACWPELGAIVTARAAGSSLGAHVRRAVVRTSGREELARTAAACTEAGEWLRNFQAKGVVAMRGSHPQHLGSPDAFLAYLDDRLRVLRNSHPGIDGALRTRLLAYAAAALHLLPEQAFDAVTWSHSDFGPHNVLMDGERITVLDFELHPQHPEFDAAYFVECLANQSGPLVDPEKVRRLERAFLAGYGAPVNGPLFALLRLRHLLCSYVSETRRSGRVPFRTWPGLVVMRARLQRFADLLALRSRARAA